MIVWSWARVLGNLGTLGWFVATPLILVCKLVCIDIELHMEPKGSSIEFLIILVSFDVLNAEWIVFDMQK